MVKLTVVLIVLLVGALQTARFRRRMNAPDAAGQCIACDSTNLVTLGVEAYRCQACGYEGGSGLNAIAQAQADAALSGMAVDERQRIARKRLRAAQHILMGVGPRSRGNLEEVERWFSTVEAAALHAAADLDEAARAGGGRVDLPGYGAFDPKPYASRLRTGASPDTPYKQVDVKAGDLKYGVIVEACAALDQALAGVPLDPPDSGGQGAYRT